MWLHDAPILLLDGEDAYRRFLAGERVPLEDAAGARDGPCLVSQANAFRFDPREPLLSTLENLWLAGLRCGRVTREVDQPLRQLLPGNRPALEGLVRAVPMRFLEQWMCGDAGSIPENRRELIQQPDAYKKLYDTGDFTGILNRAWRHMECCMDFVWIENDVCMLWARSDSASNVQWIKLFPFRVDRSGAPGRLLKGFRRARKSLWSFFLPSRLRSLPLEMTWYDPGGQDETADRQHV